MDNEMVHYIQTQQTSTTEHQTLQNQNKQQT